MPNRIDLQTQSTANNMTDTTLNKPDNNPPKNLIQVRDLVKHYPVRGGVLRRVVAWVKAVDGVSFSIQEGETLGLVGESGCGKSTVGNCILRLLEPTSGTIELNGEDIQEMDASALKAARRNMQVIFQDPYSSLNPRKPIGDSILAGLKIHKIGNREEQVELMHNILRRVGLQPYHAHRYPHEFSGGQRQRIGIARALVLNPSFVVCDEPVSALDVSIQSQVLNLLRDLQDEFNLTYLFIAHNLSVVEHISDRVAVMYLGKIVEMAPREHLFKNPLHMYTKALISAIPIPDPTLEREHMLLEGEVPSPLNPPPGCHFHPRCPIATEECSKEDPVFEEVAPNHWVACFNLEQAEAYEV